MHYKVRYRDPDGRAHSETIARRVALRQCAAAAVADGRLTTNPADAIPLPTERQRPVRYLSQPEVERLVAVMPRRYQALVLVGAYAGLRWGEAAGLRRRDVDPLRSRIRVTGSAIRARDSSRSTTSRRRRARGGPYPSPGR